MPYPSDSVGTRAEAITHEVDARWLLAYAAVLEETDARLTDTRRAEGIVAHPLFPVCLEWPCVVALRRTGDWAAFERGEFARGVHATHDLHLHRAIRPGDRLTTVAQVVAAEMRRPGAYETVRLETRDAHGELVATTYMGNLFRGVELKGEARRIAEVPAAPEAPPESPAGARRSETVVRSLPANLGHTYTECARIWNPIHTDPAVAEAAGLPAPILHGTATLALAVSAAWPWLGGPERVARICARFSGMVVTPAKIEIALGGDRSGVWGSVALSDRAQPVLRDFRALPRA